MFWDFEREQAVRFGEWKLWRTGTGDRLFHIAKDPAELHNVIDRYPEQVATMKAQLDKWVATLPASATAELAPDVFWNHALRDAPAGVSADPRYLIPYDNPVPTPYPVL